MRDERAPTRVASRPGFFGTGGNGSVPRSPRFDTFLLRTWESPAILANDDVHSSGDTMEFLLIGHDGTDEGALGRRLAVRERQ